MQRRLVRRMIPHAKRPAARAVVNRLTWRAYAGDRVRCNCCETSFRRFRVYRGAGGHRALMCPRCGSLGRHRVDWLYLTERTDALDGSIDVLHIAPEICLEEALRARPNVRYRSADYDSTLAMDQVDITDMHYADASFDGVICNHVLNFVDDEPRAIRELHRVVRPNGWALLQSAVNSSLEQTRELSGPEHPSSNEGSYEEVWMREYGRDYGERLAEAGFEVDVADIVKDLGPEIQRKLGLDPDETIFFCRKPATAAHEAGAGARAREPMND